MHSIDVEDGEVRVGKRLEIGGFRGLRVKIRCVKIVKKSVHGNKSKGMIFNVTEQNRCFLEFLRLRE